MSRGASLAIFLPWQYQPPSLPVSALLPWQYQPSFLASIKFPSLPVSAFLPWQYQLPLRPAASLAVPKASPMNPHCAPRLYILTHPSPQVAVQQPQRRRKEGAQRRGGQRHRDRVLARKGRTEKGATMHGVCGTLCGTQKLECTVEQRLGISGAGRSPPRAPSAAPRSIFPSLRATSADFTFSG